MKKFAGALFYLLTMVSAEAADRWPPDVCKQLAVMEAFESEAWANFPQERAIARGSLLTLQHFYCDVDVSAKLHADSIAASMETTGRPRRPKTCSTIDLGGGLSTTNCN